MRNLILLILILALAAFFRFYQLDQIPPGLYPDEAMNANQAITEPGKVFYTDNNGREGLFINLLWLSFSLFGISIWSFKIVPAIFGTLTVLGVYLLTRELFWINPKSQILNSKQITNHKSQILNGLEHWSIRIWNLFRISNLEFRVSHGEIIALLSSFFLAVSFWHVNFSRIGFRAILLPFFLVFSFYFLFRGIRIKKLLNFILAGILFGLGFYTYTSFRMAVFLFPLPLLYWVSTYQVSALKKLFFIFYFLFFIFITALPLGFYFLQHPKDFTSRAMPISVFTQENLLAAFAESFAWHLAMFNVYGDPNWRHNYAGSPQLLWPIGLLFIIGIAVSLKEIIKHRFCFIHHRHAQKTFQHSIECRSVFTYIFLFCWLIILLLPGALTYEGLPHALRTIGVIPVPYIFAAIGGCTLWQWFSLKKIPRKLLILFALFFVSALTFTEYHRYFIAWGKNKEVEGAFTKQYVEIGNYLNSLPDEVKKYVIVNEYGAPLYGISIPAQTPMFIERTKYGLLRAKYVKAEELSTIEPGPGKTVIVPLYPESLSQPLLERFPQGTLEKINEVTVFKIEI